MTQETFEQMVERVSEEADAMADAKLQMPGEYHPDWHNVRDLIFATRLHDELAKGQEPVAHIREDGQFEDLRPWSNDIPPPFEPFTSLYTRPFVAAPARVPNGWKLVPVEPTDEMIDAAPSSSSDTSADDAFIKGILYAANKYEKVRGERFSGGDVADFLTMEAEEMTEDDIRAAIKESNICKSAT